MKHKVAQSDIKIVETPHHCYNEYDFALIEVY